MRGIEKENAIEVQVQQHKKILRIVLILLFLMTINISFLSIKLNRLIEILNGLIQIFAVTN